MTAYILTAGTATYGLDYQSSILIDNTVRSISFSAEPSNYGYNPPSRRVLLKRKTVAEVEFEAARFARWSENGTNGINKIYRQFLQDGYPSTDPNGNDVTALD